VGNCANVGGKQRWNNVHIIDHGSYMNADSTGKLGVHYSYDYMIAYGFRDAIISNCTFWSGHTHSFNTLSSAFGAIQINPYGATNLNIRFYNCSVFCTPGYTNRYAIRFSDSESVFWNGADTLVTDIKYYGCGLAISSHGEDECEERLRVSNDTYFSDGNWDTFTPKRDWDNNKNFYIQDTTRLGGTMSYSPLDISSNDTLVSISKQVEFIQAVEREQETENQVAVRQMNLTIPKLFFKGEGTITVKKPDATYTSGSIIGHGNAELDLFNATGSSNGCYIMVQDSLQGWRRWLLDYSRLDEDTAKVSSTTKVCLADTQFKSVEYYYLLYGGGPTWINCKNIDTLYVTFDAGYDRFQSPIFLDFLLSIGQNDGAFQYGSLYQVKVANKYTSIGTIATYISADSLTETGSPNYAYDVTKIEAVNYASTSDKRYLKIRFCDIKNANRNLAMHFITAIGVKNVKVTKYRTRF
jgi:hypothetical protein